MLLVQLRLLFGHTKTLPSFGYSGGWVYRLRHPGVGAYNVIGLEVRALQQRSPQTAVATAHTKAAFAMIHMMHAGRTIQILDGQTAIPLPALYHAGRSKYKTWAGSRPLIPCSVDPASSLSGVTAAIDKVSHNIVSPGHRRDPLLTKVVKSAKILTKETVHQRPNEKKGE